MWTLSGEFRDAQGRLAPCLSFLGRQNPCIEVLEIQVLVSYKMVSYKKYKCSTF